jgi:hypothetical protein
MSRIRCSVIRQTLLAGFVALGLPAIAAAQTAAPATGLGQAWPNAVDLSHSPSWHVYVFERDGIRYIQINDRNGTVHAALGQTGDTVFALPVGVDSDHVTVAAPAQNDALPPAIYQDESISVMAVPQSDSTTQIMVKVACADIGKCVGGRISIMSEAQ